jgi:lipoprotein signal peptidase
MTPYARWRLAVPLLILSLLCLGATGLGAWLYWSVDDNVERFITVFLALMFTLNAGMSVSIGTGRNVESIPWLRIAIIIVFFVLACGVTIARDNV